MVEHPCCTFITTPNIKRKKHVLQNLINIVMLMINGRDISKVDEV